MNPHPAYVFTATLRKNKEAATVEAPPRPELLVGPPPELGGDPHEWSAEHLLLASVCSCFYTTFRALAQRGGLAVNEFVCHVTGTVDKTQIGLLFSAIRLAVEVDVIDASAFALARSLLDKAERRCIVTQALRVPVTVDAAVTMTPRSDVAAQALR